MKKFALILAFLFAEIFCYSQENDGLRFEFKYKKGDAYRILSTVQEDVFFNDNFHHHAEILNRISVKVNDVDKNGRGAHSATFMTTENSTGKAGAVFSYGEDYVSEFTRDAYGKYEISDKYFMPVVRDVPIFPQKKILPGEKWVSLGHEAHDLRRSFDIQTPYKIPFNAQYQYLGPETDDNGKIFYKFDVQYNMEYSVDLSKYDFSRGEVPVATKGFSHQTIYWDIEKGCIDHYSEDFEIVMATSGNNILRFAGKAHAEVTDSTRTADEKNIAAVQEKVRDLGINDVTVKAGEKGLTLSIENIQFMPDSGILMESERQKLNKISAILKAYPNNDLLITGHTAFFGTEEQRLDLSRERAQAVANYLIQKKVRDKYHVFTKGMGGDSPIADNRTKEGRAKNRRVEITIMDK